MPSQKAGTGGKCLRYRGCYSQGETVEELLANLREPIAGVLEVMRQEGRTLGENVQVMELAV
jgi:predicted RNase H-like HicB family nuclease